MKKGTRKYWKEILAILGLLSLFVFTRLVNLTIIPIFTDEAIYLRWSQIMASDASMRFLPLIDGKQPLYMWAVMGLMKVLKGFDPLVVGRMTSGMSGLVSMLGVGFTAWQIFKRKNVAYLSAVLYLIVPFTLFYDRFALADSMLAMWGVWILGLSVWLARTPRLDLALILGGVMGFGMLTKTPALFFVLFCPLSLVFFDFKAKKILKRMGIWLGLFVLMVGISQMFYSILRLFPLFQMIAQKNSEFAVSFVEFVRNPTAYFFGNISSMISWEVAYLTIPIFLMVVWSLVRSVQKRQTGAPFLFINFLGFILAMSLFNKRIYPRYLLLYTPAILIMAAAGIDEWFSIKFISSRKWLIGILAATIFVFPIYTDFLLLTNPVMSPIPKAESSQYLNSWPAGFGVSQIAKFLTHESAKGRPIFLATEGTFGLMPYALELYNGTFPNVSIKSYWPLPKEEPVELVQAKAKGSAAFVLVYQSQDSPKWKNTDEIFRFRQGVGDSFLRLYEVH